MPGANFGPIATPTSACAWGAMVCAARFLRVAYADLKTRVLEGGTDEEILDWCFQQGRKPSEVDLLVWNEFGRKLGWNDRATPVLDKLKAESGLAGRNDIVTLFDYTDVDECRKS